MNLNRVADITDPVSDLRLLKSLEEAFLCPFDQKLLIFTYITDKICPCRISTKTVKFGYYITSYDISVLKDYVFRRNTVNDFFVDRCADRGRERRITISDTGCRSACFSDDSLSDIIELLSRYTGYGCFPEFLKDHGNQLTGLSHLIKFFGS